MAFHIFFTDCETESLILTLNSCIFIWQRSPWHSSFKQNGRVAIEIAAIQGWKECVEVLFPVTAPLARVADWSIDGLLQHARFMSSKPQVWTKTCGLLKSWHHLTLELIVSVHHIFHILFGFRLCMLFSILCSMKTMNLIMKQKGMPHSVEGIILMHWLSILW